MIILVAGTRPEAVKLAPVIWALRESGSDFVFIWSGQHYDYELSRIFFEELDLPEPDFNLDVRSGTHGQQTSSVMLGVENVLKKFSRYKGIVVSEGDTNTVLGAGLAAVKSGWLFAHVEAGLRSYNRIMPEEINRLVAGVIGNVHFAPSMNSIFNLLYEGVEPWRVFLTGNTVVDALMSIYPRIKFLGNELLSKFGVESDFGVVTLHRAENVDNPYRLKRILNGLHSVSKHINLVFPLHPRTRKRISEFGLWDLIRNSRIKILEPLGYFEFLGLLSIASIVFTDSGGVQEEAFTLGVPTVTLRYNTERPETVWLGGNFLVGDNPERILRITKYIINNRNKIVDRIRTSDNPYGDGNAGKRIASILKKLIVDKDFYEKYSYKEPNHIDSGSPSYRLINGSHFRGTTIDDFHRNNPGLLITLVYDENGDPIVPNPETIIKKEWKLRVFAPRNILRGL